MHSRFFRSLLRYPGHPYRSDVMVAKPPASKPRRDRARSPAADRRRNSAEDEPSTPEPRSPQTQPISLLSKHSPQPPQPRAPLRGQPWKPGSSTRKRAQAGICPLQPCLSALQPCPPISPGCPSSSGCTPEKPCTFPEPGKWPGSGPGTRMKTEPSTAVSLVGQSLSALFTQPAADPLPFAGQAFKPGTRTKSMIAAGAKRTEAFPPGATSARLQPPEPPLAALQPQAKQIPAQPSNPPAQPSDQSQQLGGHQ